MIENIKNKIEIKAGATWESYIPPIITSLILLVLLLSIFFFQNQSLRLDEAQSLWQASYTPLKVINIVAQDVHVPLYHVILHFWQLFFGMEVHMSRLLSLIFFILSIPIVYALGKLCYSKGTALFATTLFAISPFMNWYGNEIRMYSLFTFIVLINQYFFVKILKNTSRGAWIGFAISAIFGMYTHYFFFLILLVDILFFLYNKKLFEKGAMKKIVKILVLLFVLFLPWIIYVYYLGQISNTTPLLQSPTTVNFFNTFSEFLFGFQTDHLNTILVSLWPLTILFVFLSLRKNKKIMPETIYLLLAFLLPNIVAFGASLLLRPVYVTRYLIFTMPFMYFIISWLLSIYPKKIAMFGRSLLIIIMLTTLFIEAVSASTPVREDYREAVEYLEEHALASHIIVVSAPFTIFPVLYYYNGSSAITTLPIWNMRDRGPIPPFIEEKLPTELEIVKANHDYMWLLLSYDQGYQEKLRIYMDTHLERTFYKQFSDGLYLYGYKLRYYD